MKAEFSRFGPKHDYRGAHVTLKYGERILLGTITDVYRREIPACYVAKVRHFCGDAWPIDPALSALTILEREYD